MMHVVEVRCDYMISTEINTEKGIFSVKYALTKTASDAGDCLTYGIEVTLEGGGVFESVRIDDISTEKQQVLLLAERMRDGAVTPATAADVIDDHLNGL